MTPYAACGTLLLTLLGLAGCGGSSGGGSGMALIDTPPLANVTPGTPPPCLAAFAPVDPADSGALTPNPAVAMASLQAANTLVSDEAPRATNVVSRMLAASGMPSDSEPLTPLTPVVIPLSSCESKLGRNRDVVIGPGPDECGPWVVIDQSFKGAKALGKITIKAHSGLSVPDLIPNDLLEIETAGITVAGTLSIGTSACPVGGKDNPTGRVKVTFTGLQGDANPDPEQFAGKGIEVQKSGILRLYGAKGVESRGGVNWTHLSRPAGPVHYQNANAGIKAPVAAGGERRLSLAKDVSKGSGNGWQAGDWIVIATSSFSPFESEFAQIESVSADGRELTLVKEHALRHYHFGGADPGLPSEANYGAGKELNYGVDERSEVGLISRNITFTARTTTTTSMERHNPDQNHHWGGEIRIAEGFAEASVQGVELEKFGKARLGSYPIHFHMVGKVASASSPPPSPAPKLPLHLIDSNSIHHSYNKCVTVHMSQGVKISNNVCARVIGHLFYQEMAEEQGGEFLGNLGIGAMSQWFGAARDSDGRVKNWWEGDNLAKANGYDGLNVPNVDAQTNPMHGRCYRARADGGLELEVISPWGSKACEDMYVEQPSGFWIGNPGTVLEGNSIAGCQGQGKAYWYVPPADVGIEDVWPRTGKDLKYAQRFEKVGRFNNNRAHACHDGLFAEGEAAVVSAQLFPTDTGTSTGKNLITHFTNFTATRIRNRGVWIRPMWTAVEHGRFATNRESVSLVSSGGADGNAPGVWALLKDSVVVGISENNVDRWGPCPPPSGPGRGCVDHNPLANELDDKGYQSPAWNSAGYMIYDGPVRIIHNHFVNFLRDITPHLTKEDANLITGNNFQWSPGADYPDFPPAKTYEGDAALGWFQENQSAYPTATVTKALSFDNVDLRHQIYTDRVNTGTFKDGDKNTALIDLDGTLSGYQIVDASGNRVKDEYPVSLNNLPFNRTGNAVDECYAEGQQDSAAEGRSTSIMSPANVASLEFEAAYPLHPAHPAIIDATWQDMVFTKDSLDGGARQSMALQSRNGQGIWEPKVASGTGYTVRTAPSTQSGHRAAPPPTGMPGTVRVGLTDAVKPNMGAKPFHVRVGICYTNAKGRPPAGNFTIQRGYKSWGGNGVDYNSAEIRRHFNFLSDLYKAPGATKGQTCFNLDAQNAANMDPVHGCPADGVTLKPDGSACPAGTLQTQDKTGAAVCVYEKKALVKATSIAEITNADGTPTADGFKKYYFDPESGMLFFYVMQDSANAKAKAPLGSCGKASGNDPACPGDDELETYFSCPPQGCINYSVVLNDTGYTPGPSQCDALALSKGGSIYGPGGYALPEPVTANYLGYADAGQHGKVEAIKKTSSQGFLHWVPADEPSSCKKMTTDPIPFATPVADAGASTSAKVFSLAQWLRESILIGSAATLDGSKKLFAAQPPPAPQIEAMAQICKASPG